METKQTETDLVRACLGYLAVRNIFAWRNNSGLVMQTYKGKARPVRFGKVGSADILGILPASGRLLAVECKVGRNKTTPAQDAFLEAIRGNGGVAVVVRSMDELHEALIGIR